MDLLKSFEREKTFLTIVGFYPLKRDLKYNLRAFIFLTIFLILLCTLVIAEWNNRNDFERVVFDSACLFTQFGFILKLFNFSIKSDRMRAIEQHLQNPIFQFHSKREQKTIQTAIDRVDFLANIYRFMCFETLVMYAIIPFINQSFYGKNLELPIPGWVPFDTAPPLQYAAGSIFLLGTFMVSAFVNSTIDILSVKLDTLATMKFTILANFLQDINYNGRDIAARTELRKCIIFHNEIIKFVSEIEDTFSNGILAQYFASIVIICINAFQLITVEPKSLEFGSSCTYVSAMIIQIGMYCWYGHHLTYETEQLIKACYMTNWYESDAKTRRTLLIFMERAKRASFLTAGKFFNLTLSTLIMLLRSSYSYFTVLRRLYA